MKESVRLVSGLLMVGMLSGCAMPGGGSSAAVVPGSDPDALVAAQALYEEGRYTEAMLASIDLARREPDRPGVAELQKDIIQALTKQQRAAADAQEATTPPRLETEIATMKALPDTYNVRRPVTGVDALDKLKISPMQKSLERRVTVHLEEVGISDFILEIGKSENINIIADSGLAGTGTMTIHAENVPLSEVLDYVSRNLGVSFYVGDNIIWVTAGSAGGNGPPLETKLYKLRKGLASEEVEGDPDSINIVETVNRFVPPADGSELAFNKKAHVLIARNTRENLLKIEEIIEALDVCPPQVLIEARFISASVADLSELGIDWTLNSQVPVTKRKVLENGAVVTVPETVVDAGAAMAQAPFANAAEGLNLSYRGLLTDPGFKAVLHALEKSGKSRTLSAPKVATVNNKLAKMRVGEDFRYFEEYEIRQVARTEQQGSVVTTVNNDQLVPVGSPTVEELGIELSVTPSVGSDMKTISLKMLPEISEFVRWEYYQVAGGSSTSSSNALSLVKLPVFRRSNIETEVVVGSGETVVMGGLVSSTETHAEQKIPILSSLPLIGRLFRHDSVTEDKQNLLIFVTATILSDRGEKLLPVVNPEQQ